MTFTCKYEMASQTRGITRVCHVLPFSSVNCSDFERFCTIPTDKYESMYIRSVADPCYLPLFSYVCVILATFESLLTLFVSLLCLLEVLQTLLLDTGNTLPCGIIINY